MNGAIAHSRVEVEILVYFFVIDGSAVHVYLCGKVSTVKAKSGDFGIEITGRLSAIFIAERLDFTKGVVKSEFGDIFGKSRPNRPLARSQVCFERLSNLGPRCHVAVCYAKFRNCYTRGRGA
jgi:hypothetical protein